MNRHRLVLSLASLAAFFCCAARAAEPEVPAAAPAASRQLLQPPKMSIASPITDRFAVRGVYYRPKVATSVRYDATAGTPGTLISGEDTLGLDDQLDQGSLDMMFRIGERHRIQAGFHKQTRSGDVVLAQDVEFGDETFSAGERTLGKLDLRRLGLVYTYSLLRRERIEVGLGLGIHLLQLEGIVEAPATFQRETLDTAGPFPTLALDASWRVTRRFSLNAGVQYLDASIDEVEGGFQSWHADVQFRAWRNLAFGAGYTHAQYRVDSTDPDDFAGYFKLKYNGPEVFFRVSF